MATAEHIEGRAAGPAEKAPAGPGRPRRLVLLAWIALVAVAALDAGAIWAATGFEHDLAPSAALVVGVTLSASVTGLLVVRRHPANAIGWLLTAHGLLVCLVLNSDSYAYWGGVLHPGRVPLAGWIALWSDISWPLLYIGLVLTALVFPDGRFLSPWWRRFALAACLAVVLFVLASAFDVDRFDGRLASLSPPLPKLPDPLVFPLEMVGLAGIAAGLVGAAVAARRRFRRSTGIARVQMLWFAYAALAIPAGLATCLVDQLVTGGIGGITLVGVCVSGTLIPLAIGAAILRHRLFDIELVLSRTLVYGFLTVVVVVVYAAAILGVGSLVDDRGVAGLAAVAVVSVVIHPLHARVRRAVERWV